MGKKREISQKERSATNRIAALASENGIKLTDSYAVAKELVTRGAVNYAFTRWGVEENGTRVLVILATDQMSIRAIENPKERYSSIRTVAPEFVKVRAVA